MQINSIFLLILFLVTINFNHYSLSENNFNCFDYSQKELDRQIIIQKSINFVGLISHLEKNPLIKTGEVLYIKHDKRINDLQLTFKNINLQFNDGKGADNFFYHWSFAFEEIKIRHNTANISFRFVPGWHHCSTGAQLVGGDNIFIKIILEFKNDKGTWNITNAEMNDIVFPENAPTCIIENYIKL